MLSNFIGPYLDEYRSNWGELDTLEKLALKSRKSGVVEKLTLSFSMTPLLPRFGLTSARYEATKLRLFLFMVGWVGVPLLPRFGLTSARYEVVKFCFEQIWFVTDITDITESSRSRLRETTPGLGHAEDARGWRGADAIRANPDDSLQPKVAN